MNSYERNTGMVVCILGVLIVGAVLVGALAYFGPTIWGFNITSNETVYFHFDETVGSTTGTVTLDVDITTGTVNIEFEDNATLLYRIDVGVPNQTLQEYNDPSVTFSSNTITLDYIVLAANITLGSGINYTLNVETTTGSIDCDVTDGAHIGDVTLKTTTGSIDFYMVSGVNVTGSPDFIFETSTGSIDLIMILPSEVGGSILGSVGTGTVDIDAPGWTQETSSYYKSSNYDSADQIVTVVAQTGTGTIDAHISN
ncbi:MAG: hypothetical protein ACFE7R_03715 [Candidatus Hodarchaeota archaeon]